MSARRRAPELAQVNIARAVAPPDDPRPGVEEALDRLALLQAEGARAEAFIFKTRCPAPGALPAEAA